MPKWWNWLVGKVEVDFRVYWRDKGSLTAPWHLDPLGNLSTLEVAKGVAGQHAKDWRREAKVERITKRRGRETVDTVYTTK